MFNPALRRFCGALFLLCCVPLRLSQASAPIDIDAHAASTPFPHFWEKAFGAIQAILSLRESYRDDIRELKKVADFQSVPIPRHFHDEVGVYDEDEKGNAVTNFSYVDQIYDGLLANRIDPVCRNQFYAEETGPFRQDVHPF